MSAATAIGRVSESLRNLLLEEMFPADGGGISDSVAVTILAPDESGAEPRRINLFLYKVEESPFLRNQDWQVSHSDTGLLQPPPLSLTLQYLLTPYAPNDPVLGNVAVHEILGEAMRVFYEYPVVPHAYLAHGLRDAREEIRIMRNGIDVEELSQVWGTFSAPFRLSVLYEVSVVQLHQRKDAAIPGRVRAIGAPQVEATHQPPVVQSVEPSSGPSGTTVCFSGEHLDGWSAHVTVMRRRIVDGVRVSGTTFEAELPADLAPGFYELRVDVGQLFRRVFWFEVTEATT
jgi:hypothetical protein